LYFDAATDFVHGYAMVIRRSRYFHIDINGKVAYPWRFSDLGHVDEHGVVMVQHPRALGWSQFHIPTATFLTNPPRYPW